MRSAAEIAHEIEVIAKLGVEGGSFSIERTVGASGARFRIRTSDQLGRLLDEPEPDIVRASAWFDSLESALDSLHAKWWRFAVVHVAAGYEEQLAELRARARERAMR